jgi:hypothetical protein
MHSLDLTIPTTDEPCYLEWYEGRFHMLCDCAFGRERRPHHAYSGRPLKPSDLVIL